MSRLLILILPMLLAACAPATYKPVGEPSQPMAAALKECGDKARTANPSKTAVPEFKIAMARQDMTDACMEAKGWQPSQN